MTALSNSLILSKPRSPSLHFSSGNFFNLLLFSHQIVLFCFHLLIWLYCLFIFVLIYIAIWACTSYWRIVEWLCFVLFLFFISRSRWSGLFFVDFMLPSELMICVCRAPYYTQIGDECVYSLLIWLYYLVLMHSFTDFLDILASNTSLLSSLLYPNWQDC